MLWRELWESLCQNITLICDYDSHNEDFTEIFDFDDLFFQAREIRRLRK